MTGARGATMTGALVARVLTDVSGIDKEFDYTVPAHLADEAQVGCKVRVDLAGRRVGGWIVALGELSRDPDLAISPEGSRPALKAVAALRGWGPTADLVDLAAWAAWRWAANRALFLGTASSRNTVRHLPAPRLAPPAPPPALRLPTGPGAHVVAIGPAEDPTVIVAQAAQLGPLLVIVPTASRAAVLARRLRRAGGDVALLPEEWAQARAGAAVIVGSRGAAWAPCPGVAAVVVIDAHDELHTSERAPTWNSVGVAVERAERAGVPCYLITSCPGPELVALGPTTTFEAAKQKAGWASMQLVDQRSEDPRLGLYSSRLVDLLRSTEKVACVLNTTGRVRLLACGACGTVARCDVCHAAVSSPEPGVLSCQGCGAMRPYVCASCTSIRLSWLRVGTSRAREDLERLGGRDVGEVTAATKDFRSSSVLVGTEALLRRLDPSSGFATIVFLDFDRELLAARFGAAEHSLALLSTASRLVRGAAGLVVVQTRMPDHPVLQAATVGDPAVALSEEDSARRALRLPPYGALAIISGAGGEAWIASLRERHDGTVEVMGPNDGKWLVKAPDHRRLCDLLRSVGPPGGNVRVAVDPQRL